MVRISLASNVNRSQMKVAMAPERAELKALIGLAKDKLRLKGVKGFYTSSGMDLKEGVELQDDMLILAHRGEAFVGKMVPDGQSADATPSPLLGSAPTLLERVWKQTVSADLSRTRLRILSFNILAPCLAQGTASPEKDPAREDETLELSLGEHSVCLATAACEQSLSRESVRTWGVRYTEKQGGCKQLSHNFKCPASALDWKHRFPMLQTELLQHSPDLLCLQEMDATAWGDCQRLLRAQGYSSGVCSHAKGGANNFVAMFWREGRLRPVDEPEIIYLKAQGTITALMQRLCLVDVSSDGGGGLANFVAVTTHLKAGLKEADEQDRAKQANDLLAVIDRYIVPGEDVLFTGDLNAHLEDLPFYGGVIGAKSPSALRGLVVPRFLRSGYRCAVHEATDGPMGFSQWCQRCDVEIKSVIDHIFLRGPHFSACAALAAPDDSAVIAAGCLPNPSYPSDHIPVIVDLAVHHPWRAAVEGLTSDPVVDSSSFIALDALPPSSSVGPGLSERELLTLGRSLPQDGRVAVTEDGFKYIALPKEWQSAREQLTRAALAFDASSMHEVLSADRAALAKHLSQRHADAPFEWGFWPPTSRVGLHVTLGKHADSMGVGKRVRFQVKKLLSFLTRKLGEPSTSGGPNLFGARWFTFEVSLIDSVRCDGEEPHISFAVFGARWRG